MVQLHFLMDEQNMLTMDGYGNGASKKLNGLVRTNLLSTEKQTKKLVDGQFATKTI